MAMIDRMLAKMYFLFILVLLIRKCSANDILGCGGFVKSHVNLDFSKIEIGLYTKEGSLKERTECAPTNGYYFLPLYEKGQYILKVHPPAGWSFEPSQVDLQVDGTTDPCSTGQDINFAFNGFGITGRVITAGQKQGPHGIAVQLVNDKGEKRDTMTTVGGDFHFTPVIPGKYTLKANHPRWKLEPAQAVVQVTEGNTALPVGVLAVKGYDVKGSVVAYNSPISGVYVLLYSKEENPKFRVEGCNTALLADVPGAPICHSVTDSNGEFNFGLVPAGDYYLLALSKSPGQADVSYNLKSTKVPFSVAHDSLYIKNAFEVTGFTVVGTLLSGAAAGAGGVAGARVELDGAAAATTDAAGKFTLPALQPAVYTLTFKHDDCEIEPVQVPVSVAGAGPAGAVRARAARWRVCGRVRPAAPGRSVRATGAKGATAVSVTDTETGNWCTFLPAGTYTVEVEVSEQEHRNGLRFYPASQQVSVSQAPVDGVTFSQLKAQVSGKVQCKAEACRDLQVTLRPLSADGQYVGQPLTTTAKDGEYTFSDVLPGSVSVSVPESRLCWPDAAHNVPVAGEQAQVPPFTHTGYALYVRSKHDIEVEYSSASDKGVFPVSAGETRLCVPHAELYTLTPRGCHQFQPSRITVDLRKETPPTVDIVAVSHASVIRILSPVAATDLVLSVQCGAKADPPAPLTPKPHPDGGYYYEHTIYLAEGSSCSVSATSSSLLLWPAGPWVVTGSGACGPALALSGTRALTLAGQVRPPVPGVTVTVTQANSDTKLQQVTTDDGAYSFGPLDAALAYTVTAEKESYVFGERRADGTIPAHKLAEITVQLLDDEDDTPLQGALVSVSGGTYRRNIACDSSGRARFPALQPAQYYVKPHMKEYRFQPHSQIVHVKEGLTHHLDIKGQRVAWSCVGRLAALGGAGWPAAVRAAPRPTQPPQPPQPPHCTPEDANTDASGAFRIRGLLPNCVYTIELKESSSPELKGLKLAKAPPTIEVKDNKDVTGIYLIGLQPHQITDGSVLVRARNTDHYRTLRLTLAAEASPHSPVFAAKMDAAGHPPHNHPGVMHVLPRLPADNNTYILHLESTLSKATHSYEDQVFYFNSDGVYKHFTIDFEPKVRTSELELRQASSLVLLPGLVLVGLVYAQRALVRRAAAALWGRARPPRRAHKPDVLDKASIDHILNVVNPPAKKSAKKKVQ